MNNATPSIDTIRDGIVARCRRTERHIRNWFEGRKEFADRNLQREFLRFTSDLEERLSDLERRQRELQRLLETS